MALKTRVRLPPLPPISMRITENRDEFVKYVSGLSPKGSVCAEIGVLTGSFSLKIFKYIKPSKLFLIDPWEKGRDKNGEPTYKEFGNLPTAYSTPEHLDIVKAAFSKEITNKTVVIKKDFSYNVVDSFQNNFFDFIYIDSCHLYECIKSDLKIFLPKLKEQGLMCGHDYANKLGFGVVKAVDEFILENNFEWVAKSKEKDPDWALRRRKRT